MKTKLAENLAMAALVLSATASIYIAFSTVDIHSITALVVPGETGDATETVTRMRWFQLQGGWGVFVLLVFTGLYAGGYLLARRGAAFWLAAYWVGLLALSYLSGFSVGLFYVPALLLLLIATGLLVTEKIKASGSNRAPS